MSATTARWCLSLSAVCVTEPVIKFITVRIDGWCEKRLAKAKALRGTRRKVSAEHAAPAAVPAAAPQRPAPCGSTSSRGSRQHLLQRHRRKLRQEPVQASALNGLQSQLCRLSLIDATEKTGAGENVNEIKKPWRARRLARRFE